MRLRAVALLAIAAAGCGAPRGGGTGIPEGTGPLVATYRAEFAREGTPIRRARLLLWAEHPDRLHAELLPPVGGIRLTLDAGGGRAVVVDVDEGIAYLGEAGPEAIASLTGVRVGVREVVAALLDGRTPPGAVLEREGEASGVLPSRFLLSLGSTRIALSRSRWERASRDPATLGTGEPPTGLPVRPLAEWVDSP